MDTKLKSNKMVVYIKRLCFPLALAAVIMMFTTFEGLADGDIHKTSSLYAKSGNVLRWSTEDYIFPYDVEEWFSFASEEKIKSGAYITELMFVNEKEKLSDEKAAKLRDINNNYYNTFYFIKKSSFEEWGKTAGYIQITQDNVTTYYNPQSYSEEKVKAILKEWNNDIDKINTKYTLTDDQVKKKTIDEQLSVFRNRAKALTTLSDAGFDYFVYNKSGYMTNTQDATAEDFEESHYETFEYTCENLNVIVGVGEAFYNELELPYKTEKEEATRNVVLFGSCLLVILLCTAWICLFAGKRVNAMGIHLCALDKIPLEIIFGAALFVWGMSLDYISSNTYYIFYRYRQALAVYVFTMILVYFCWLLGILLLTTVIKHFRRREFIQSTLIYKLYMLFARPVKNLISVALRGKKAARLIIYAVIGFNAAIGLLLFISGMLIIEGDGFIIFALLLLFIINALFYFWLARYTDSLSKLIEGVSNLRAGGVKERIPLLNDKYMNNVAEDINSIADGLSAAVENEMKSERMKIELITNVSHDIKTPLTSVINYVGLLEEAELPEPSAEYVRILGEKSDRLKNLVEDLFLVSKAHSGEIEFKNEEICVDDILEQAAAEYTEQFAEQNLTLRINKGEQKTMALGDGARMWRVLSNLFANAAKYSLPGTRVYFEITRENGTVCITAKNIANYEMNFDAEEIKARLKRADEARTTEGSGLGLAIAESFMELQGGRLQIEIDGDMFKVKTCLKAIDK